MFKSYSRLKTPLFIANNVSEEVETDFINNKQGYHVYTFRLKIENHCCVYIFILLVDVLMKTNFCKTQSHLLTSSLSFFPFLIFVHTFDL